MQGNNEILELQSRIAQQIQSNAQLKLDIAQATQDALDCTHLHSMFSALRTNLFGWIWMTWDLVHCHLLASGEETTSVQCSAKRANGKELLWATAKSFQRCIVSLGAAPECADPQAPWVGACVFAVVALVCVLLVWYSATTCAQALRLNRAVSAAQRDANAVVQLTGSRLRGVIRQRKFWIVIKSGIAVALWVAFMLFVLSVTSTVTWVLDLFAPGTVDESSRSSLLEAVWSFVLTAPQHIVGRASWDRILMLYLLAVIVLPLFLFISHCMRSAADDANGIVTSLNDQARAADAMAHTGVSRPKSLEMRLTHSTKSRKTS